jgi:hypothetical protein
MRLPGGDRRRALFIEVGVAVTRRVVTRCRIYASVMDGRARAYARTVYGIQAAIFS